MHISFADADLKAIGWSFLGGITLVFIMFTFLELRFANDADFGL